MRWTFRALIGLLSLTAVPAVLAAQVTYTVVTGHQDALNHYPGADGLIGNADDFVSAAPSATYGSAPNSIGSFSYGALDFVGDGSFTETGMPTGMNAITFVQGTLTAETSVAGSGGGSIITGWNLSGTEPFPGHGAYNAQIAQVNSGSYDPGTHAFTMDVNMSVTLTNGPATADNLPLSGAAYLVDAADFGTPTGNAYVDSVLVPMAQGLGADSLFFATASGVVPADSGGLFPTMPYTASIVGVSAVPLPGSLALFAPAMLALLGLGRRRG